MHHPSIQFSAEAEDIIRQVREGKSLFITGVAGSGKSTLLREIRHRLKDKKMVVTAPTGVAAVNVGGQTCHSFFGIKAGHINYGTYLNKDLRRGLDRIAGATDIFVIDEVSMVRADVMQAIDEILRSITGDVYTPFGGKQMLFIGDLFQLPSVVATKSERDYLDRTFGSEFFFSLPAFRSGYVGYAELTQVYRQTDPEFLGALNSIRSGHPTQEALDVINSRVVPIPDDDEAITLALTNKQVDRINSSRMAKLTSPPVHYEGQIEGVFRPGELPTDHDLVLKEGARVMALRNDTPEFNYVNGSTGVVRLLEEEQVVVEFDNGHTCEIKPVTWDKIIYDVDPESGELIERIIGKFTQLPLRAAFSCTIHKAQGATLDNMILDMGNGAFAHGQTYVALSRATSLEGMKLVKPIRRRDIILSQAVVNYVNQSSSGD